MAASPQRRTHGGAGIPRVRKVSLRRLQFTLGFKKGRLFNKHTAKAKVSCAHLAVDTAQVPCKFVCLQHGAFGYCTTDACITNAITVAQMKVKESSIRPRRQSVVADSQ